MPYNPSLGIPINKSLSPAQSIPTDGRSYFYDEVLFKWRPYQSTSEVFSYLNLSKFRQGHFSVFVNDTGLLNPDGTFTGGVVKEYWFRDDETTLVLKETVNNSVLSVTSGFGVDVNNLDALNPIINWLPQDKGIYDENFEYNAGDVVITTMVDHGNDGVYMAYQNGLLGISPWTHLGQGWVQLNYQTGVSEFTTLTDTFEFDTNAHKLPLVNSVETALVPVDILGGEGVDVEIDDDKIQLKTKFTTELDDSLATVAVGGLAASTIGVLKNQSLRKIIEDIIAPTLSPTYTIPTITLTIISGSLGVKEVGVSNIVQLQVAGNKNDAGAFSKLTIRRNSSDISTTNSPTSGAIANIPNQFGFANPNNPNAQFTHSYTDTFVVVLGSTTYNGRGDYEVGIAKQNNKNVIDGRAAAVRNVNAPQAAATNFDTSNQALTGIYPYFYYKSNSPITSSIMQAAIADGSATKVVADHTGTITIPFNATGEYLAVAYPATSTTKTKWWVNALDNGTIPGGVFGAVDTKSCNSPTALWSGINYKIHVSPGLITQTNPIELRNS